MVISDEFKFPRPLDWSKFSDPRRVKEIYGISAVMPIKHIQRRWYNSPAEEREEAGEDNHVGMALQQLVDQVNASLQVHGVDIHISLLRKEDGYALDIYDCTDLKACRIIKAENVNISELPQLLKNLQEGAGLLVDADT
ncbi:MAG: hypothetical protein KKD73_05690 [Proteobacteria bacterium]|nr:hypothetical protein [Pseudomonadota bacterium]MBU1639836.1 hypothetical protein [Pseudomonadota bacterium]